MIDERTEAQASLYVLGALPPEEARQFEAAMRADRGLQALVNELRDAADAMVVAYPQAAPPPGLKGKILAAVDERPATPAVVVPVDGGGSNWMGWMPWVLAACFAILCVLLISIGKSLREQAVSFGTQLEEKNGHTADLQRQLDELQARTAQQITNFQTRIVEVQRQAIQRIEEITRQAAAVTNRLQQQQAEAERRALVFRNDNEKLQREKKILEEALAGTGGFTPTDRYASTRMGILRSVDPGLTNALGAAVWSTVDQRGVLILEGLPPAPPGQSYQLWVIDRLIPSPVSAGVLPDAAAGGQRVQFTASLRVEQGERFAISVEPRGGSVAPTRVIMASN